MKLITLVPRLPPATDGVGDYALYMAHYFRAQWQIETEFIVCDPLWFGESETQGFHVTHLPEQSPSVLLQLLQSHHSQATQIFLHYVGYGYAKWGCPAWLLNALETWRSQPNHQLMTMFHELYALRGQKPWKHNFWNSPRQQSIAKQIAQISDHAVTSRQQYAEILDRFRGQPDRPTPFLPVFSTVGEPSSLPSWDDREPILVIFGQSLNKQRAYTENLDQLQTICQKFQIKEIVDVGPATGLNVKQIGATPLREAGKLSTEAIHELFSRSRLGFFNYNPEYLAKSTIFAAYCAYGLLPISATVSKQIYDGIIPGQHYWSLGESEQSLQSPQSIADQAHQWYRSHSLSAQADCFAKLLMGDRVSISSSKF